MEEQWVEVWSGKDPAPAGRKLEAAGISMRLASTGWGAHGGGFGFSLLSVVLRRQSGGAKLLVPEADRERAKAALASKSA